MKNLKTTIFTNIMVILLITSTQILRAQNNADMPSPKAITIDKSLSRKESEQLLKTARLFYAFWNTGKEEYLNQSVSQDFFDNTLPAGRPQGFKGILFASKNFRIAVPDLSCSIEDLIISKDKIVCRQIYTGINSGPVAGRPASYNQVKFFAIDILHVRDGKIFEDWHLEDNLTFLQETGVIKL